MKKIKLKTCRNCKTKFTPKYALQVVCGVDCAIQFVKTTREAKEAKEQRAIDRSKKEQLKSKSDHLKDLQVIFNQFIRIRDGNNPCISCGRWHAGQYHAGHYRSVGSAPHLRFNELNCNRQCSACNNHLSGNIINYRQGLIAKIGIKQVEQLEADQTPKHYSIDDIKELKALYKTKIKELKQAELVT